MSCLYILKVNSLSVAFFADIFSWENSGLHTCLQAFCELAPSLAQLKLPPALPQTHWSSYLMCWTLFFCLENWTLPVCLAWNTLPQSSQDWFLLILHSLSVTCAERSVTITSTCMNYLHDTDCCIFSCLFVCLLFSVFLPYSINSVKQRFLSLIHCYTPLPNTMSDTH